MVAGKEGIEKGFCDCRRAGKENKRKLAMADVVGW
jgi:hypothetical protein